MDPKQFHVTETLKNGAAVTIRAVRPDDKARLSDAFAQLEPESVYTRFFQHKQQLSNDELRAATEVDFDEVGALVVTASSRGREVIIGGGRYIVLDPAAVPRSAEVAFLVEEDYHGLGIAGRLLGHLVALARTADIASLEADVLPQNQAMLAVFARSGLPMQRQSADGVVHVTLSLAP